MDKHISLSPCPFCGMGLTLDIDEEGGVAILHSLKGEKNCWFPSIVEIEMPVETTLEEMVEILNRRPIQESFEHALVGQPVTTTKGGRMKVYTVTMYRYGNREWHSYVLGAFSSNDIAREWAVKEEEYRDGKYKAEIIRWGIDSPTDFLKEEL